MTPAEALDFLFNTVHIEDFIYTVRERYQGEMKGLKSTWDHPKVIAYAEACASLKDHLADLRAND